MPRQLRIHAIYDLMSRRDRHEEIFRDPLRAKPTSMFVILSKITNQIGQAVFTVMLHGKFTL
jgi:hypothetical protein